MGHHADAHAEAAAAVLEEGDPTGVAPPCDPAGWELMERSTAHVVQSRLDVLAPEFDALAVEDMLST